MVKPMPCGYYSVTQRNFRWILSLHPKPNTHAEMLYYLSFVQREKRKLEFLVPVTLRKGLRKREGVLIFEDLPQVRDIGSER